MYKRIVRLLIEDTETSVTNPEEERHLSALLEFMRINPLRKNTVITTRSNQPLPSSWGASLELNMEITHEYKIVLHRQEAVPMEFSVNKHPCQWLSLLNLESGKTAHFFPELDACLRAVKTVCA